MYLVNYHLCLWDFTIIRCKARQLAVSRRDRAGATMAVDRRNPNVDDFLGLNWSCWVDTVKTLPSDGESRSPAQTWFASCHSVSDLWFILCYTAQSATQTKDPLGPSAGCVYWHQTKNKCNPSNCLLSIW